ncbi:metallophosphoesterase family protein [Cohnella panacarvi]|uniref:metallophosphoesterase family protein n=1 Tax=Cohnella panacarvi TaxID=400776 RepID=UPI00047A3DC1|nr:metallophosphoesterase family protein [Cohnella panacarvi]
MNPLKFRQDGTFKIVQFTDIHWQNGDAEDMQSKDLMNEILAIEAPDLTVFTGDMIHCEQSRHPGEAFVQAVSAAIERGIPWAFVFGNHDAEEGITRGALMALARQLPGCLAQPGPDSISGVGNYCLTVHASSDHGHAAAALYLLDSGSYAPSSVGGAAWIKRDQIDWYVGQSKILEELSGGRAIPSIAFFHIPLSEFNEVWDFHRAYGHNYEGVGCARINSGLFHAFVERGDVRGVFVGHDHVNDYWGELHGIRLCYGRATGFNAYGRDGFPRGARIIELNEDGRAFKSWMRLEDGILMTDQPPHSPATGDMMVQLKKRIVV